MRIIIILMLCPFLGIAQYGLEGRPDPEIKHGIIGEVGWGAAESFDNISIGTPYFTHNIIGGVAYRYQYNRFLAEIGFLYNNQLSVPLKLGFTTRSKKHPKRVHPFFLGGINLFFTEESNNVPEPKILVNVSFCLEGGINIPIFKNMHLFVKHNGHLSAMGIFLENVQLVGRNIMMLGGSLSVGYMVQF